MLGGEGGGEGTFSFSIGGGVELGGGGVNSAVLSTIYFFFKKKHQTSINLFF